MCHHQEIKKFFSLLEYSKEICYRQEIFSNEIIKRILQIAALNINKYIFLHRIFSSKCMNLKIQELSKLSRGYRIIKITVNTPT